MKISAKFFTAACFTLIVLSCTEQHDPTEHHAMIAKEAEMAHRQPMKLTEDGKIPAEPAGGAVAEVSGIDQKYNTFCSSCHGADGAAASAVAQSMNPKPRAFTDAAWQDSVDDARIRTVIKEGGTPVGLSATMAAWGALLSDSELDEMVQKVRSFKK